MTEVHAPYVPPKRRADILPVTSRMVEEYWEWFVNRRAYLVQRHTPTPNGKYSYYTPKKKGTEEKLSLTNKDVELHLAGYKTISLYAIEPNHSTCKWIALDADYPKGFEDLASLQHDLLQDNVHATLEKSRRGAHLWILAADPLPAATCRTLVYNLALRLGVPIKGHNHEAEGIEVFPRQDRLEPGMFGNAIRGPLGVHRATVQRYFFDGIDCSLESQFAHLRTLQRLTLEELQTLTYGMEPIEVAPQAAPAQNFSPSTLSGIRTAFDITKYVQVRRKDSRNFWARCPSCARAGRDKGGDNLAIAVRDSRLYKCWAGCHKDDIRAACGVGPSRTFV